MYSVNTDRRTGVIQVVIEGFLMPDDLDRFRVALAAEVAMVRAAGHAQVMLYDCTDAVIQSQETVATLRDMARDNPFGTRRTAIYSAGRLARRQIGRIAEAGEHVRLFDDRAAAMEWLRA